MEKYRKSSENSSSESEGETDSIGVGRTYGCTFCKRGFTNAQALGGHMNIHRKDKAKARHHPSINVASASSSSSSSSSLLSCYMPPPTAADPVMGMEPISAAYSPSFAPHPHPVYYPFNFATTTITINNSPSPSPSPRFISSQPPLSLFEGNHHHHHHLPNTSTTAATPRRLFGMSDEEDPLGADLSLRISSSPVHHPFLGGQVKHHTNNNKKQQHNVDYINHDIDLELRLGYHP